MEARAEPFLTLLLLVGCSSGASEPDAAPDDASGDASVPVAPPDIPWLGDGVPPIAIAPCPDGWREVTGETDVTTCDPYPEGGGLGCPAGRAHFPGEPGCVPVGSPCSATEFSGGLPVDRRVIYVRPGAMMGDGTETQPYGSLTEFAFGGLPVGTVIALSRGMHTGPVRLAREHVLQGTCAEATTLATSMPSATDGVVRFVDAGGAIRDLTVAASPRPGVWLEGDTVVGRIEGVVVAGAEALAVAASFGAQLSMSTAVVRDTGGRASDRALGRGLTAESGATADVNRAVFSSNHEFAVFVATEDTAAVLSDVVVRGTRSQASDGLFGRGLNVQLGAMVDTSRALFSNNQDEGVYASGAGTALRMSDVVIRDTGGRASDGLGGRGLGVDREATADVSRVYISHNRELGVSANRASTSRLSDVVVYETTGQESDGLGGRGLGLQAGAVAEVSRVLFANNHEIGVSVNDAGTLVSSDVVIRDTRGRASDGLLGRGLNVQLGATAEVTRADIRGNHQVGVFAGAPGTTLLLSDVVVRDTESRVSDARFGRGVAVQLAATAEMSRTLVSGNRELGVGALSEAGVVLEDVAVSGTRPAGCAETTCAGAGAGHGIGSYFPGATTRVTRFSVRDSALCGVHVADDAALDLENGEVVGQPIGLCLQVDGYDLGRLMTNVRFGDNGVNLQATDLPVPEPAAPASP